MIVKPRRVSTLTCNGRWSTRCASALILIACVLALTSCGHGIRPTPAEPIPAALLALTSPLPNVEVALTQPCPAQLPPAPDDALPGLIRNHRESASLYHDCKQRHARLAAAARARERLEAERIERARAAMQGMRK